MGHDRDHGRMADRAAWRDNRRRLEARLAHQRCRSSTVGERRSAHLQPVADLLKAGLALTGLGGLAARRAGRLVVERHTIRPPALPAGLDGYVILHVSDVHVGNVPGVIDTAIARLADQRVDLVALTGDYQTWGRPDARAAAAEVARLLAPLSPVDGVMAVLGNHDDHRMAEALEGHGIRVLVNERTAIRRNGDALHVVGTDDLHTFYTPAATAAVAFPPEGFSLVLAHTPELADVAAGAGHHLYLCGHTHGGQICLPGGRPLTTALDSHRHLASGRWRVGGLEGYTSRALGSAQPPLRLNCPAEVALLRLERGR